MSPRIAVVGGGISGLATAWRLGLHRPDARVTVFEAAARCGGKLVTWSQDDCLAEGAADGFLARKAPALDWVRQLGLGDELIEPRPEHRHSSVWWDGALHPLPEGFSGLVPADPEGLRKTSLLTPAGADRAAAEATVAPWTEAPEESVAGFFSRRYGPEAFERLMEPLLAGIYAGDADRLSLDAAFPQLRAIERRGQSLTAGLAGTPRAEGPAFRSFRGGMARFPAALEAAVRDKGAEVRPGAPVVAVVRCGSGFSVTTAGGSTDFDAVVVALPPRAAARILGEVAPAQAAVLADWPVSSVANLTLAFDAAKVAGLPPGSGFVAPRAGGTRFSAVTWTTRKWPHRAPEGVELVRVYFGGARDPEAWKRPEAELVAEALDLLARFLGRRPVPRWTRLFRWDQAFSQLNLGHAPRHAQLQAGAVPGLVLAGGYFAGVGIPDCLSRAEEAAHLVLQGVTS